MVNHIVTSLPLNHEEVQEFAAELEWKVSIHSLCDDIEGVEERAERAAELAFNLPVKPGHNIFVIDDGSNLLEAFTFIKFLQKRLEDSVNVMLKVAKSCSVIIYVPPSRKIQRKKEFTGEVPLVMHSYKTCPSGCSCG